MPTPSEERNPALAELRRRVSNGAYIQIDSLDETGLAAMQTLLFNEEAEIVNSACRPVLIAKTDRFLLPP